MHHYLFAGTVIEKMAQALLKAHSEGMPLPSTVSQVAKVVPKVEHEEFLRMQRIGIPEQVIIYRMQAAGVDPTELYPQAVISDTCLSCDLTAGISPGAQEGLKRHGGVPTSELRGPFAGNARFQELMERRFKASEEAKAISEELAKLGAPRLFRSYDDPAVALLMARLKNVRPEEQDSGSEGWASD